MTAVNRKHRSLVEPNGFRRGTIRPLPEGV